MTTMIEQTRAWGFVEGAAIVLVTGGFGGENTYRRARVGKIYKNGNFTVEGDNSRRQFKPWSGKTAQPATREIWDRLHIRLVTPEFEQELSKVIERQKRAKRLKAVHEKL